jgi:hypothetical protein
MVIKYTNIFHCKTLQNLPKLGFFGLKICHLATLTAGRLLITVMVASAEVIRGIRDQSLRGFQFTPNTLTWISIYAEQTYMDFNLRRTNLRQFQFTPNKLTPISIYAKQTYANINLR